jgi:multidrug efflux pump subunit AcrB
MMRRVLDTQGRSLKWMLDRPWALGVIALGLLVAGYLAYGALGSNLLPPMDEGAFVIDYIMPAGSSLEETSRVLSKVEKILRDNPDVLITTRRTGLQLGLAAVTEANTGDISVRLKPDRKSDIEDIMSDVRGKIQEQTPQLDVEFTQVLEDMIGDLSNSPEPIRRRSST